MIMGVSTGRYDPAAAPSLFLPDDEHPRPNVRRCIPCAIESRELICFVCGESTTSFVTGEP
jgi:hypothetical protein